MKIRRYIAKDMRQALRQVRECQGEDAVILSSRRTEEGVEVVAAIDFDAESVANTAGAPAEEARPNDFAAFLDRAQRASTGSDAFAVREPALANDDIGNELKTLRRILETQIATLAWNDLSRRAPVQTELLKDLTQLGLSQPLALDLVAHLPSRMELAEAHRTALAMIARRIPIAEERWLERGGIVALVGPTGVGKTTSLAKLAARWVMRHGPRDLALISADTVRIGAQDQIQTLGRLLGAASYSVDHMGDLGALLAGLKDRRLVLIDTAGLGQRDTRLAAELGLLAAHPNVETALVAAASAQAGALEETFARFAPAMPKSCLLTKMDEATSLGGSISSLIRSALPLMYVSEGQRVPEDLTPARGHHLVARAVELARRSGAHADEELLTLRFGGVAHALA